MIIKGSGSRFFWKWQTTPSKIYQYFQKFRVPIKFIISLEFKVLYISVSKTSADIQDGALFDNNHRLITTNYCEALHLHLWSTSIFIVVKKDFIVVNCFFRTCKEIDVKDFFPRSTQRTFFNLLYIYFTNLWKIQILI